MARLFILAFLLYFTLCCTPNLIFAAHSTNVVQHSPPSGLSNTTFPPSGQSFATLGRIKLGLAAAFFFSVLIACGLPIVLIDWLHKKKYPLYRSTTNDRICHTDQVTAGLDDNSDGECLRECTNHDGSGLRRGPSWSHAHTSNHKISTGSEPPSTPIPSPAHAENTDLLTGTLVASAGGAGWRRYHHHQLGVDRHRDRSSMQQLRTKRSSSRAISQSATSQKMLLQLWFSRFNCFAAGIFLSSGFMELYVDVEESIEVAKTRMHVTSEFPFAPFLTLIGFFLVLSIEQVIWAVRAAKQSSNHGDVFASSPQRSPPTFENGVEKGQDSVAESPLTAVSPLNTDTHFLFTDEVVLPAMLTPTASTQPHRRPVAAFDDDDSGPNESGRMPRRLSKPQYSPSHQHHYPTTHHHSHLPSADSVTSFGSLLQVIVLLCAMSVHSLFEGLAVGLQSTVQHTLALFSAILLHKLIIAAGIGVNLATATTHESSSADASDRISAAAAAAAESVVSRRVLVYQSTATLILASSSPLGVLIGWALMRQDPQSGLLLMSTAVLQGLACGTFFFVVFCELLPNEFREGAGDRLGKLSFLILGFFVVALYSFFMPH